MMKTWTLWVIACAAMAGPLALAQDASTLAAIRAACAGDAAKLCAGIQPGGGRVIACLKEHKDALSDQCKQAAAQGANASTLLAPGSTPASPSTQTRPAGPDPSSPSTTAVAAPTAAGSGVAPPAVVTHSPVKSSHPASTPGASASQDSTTGRYLRLKQVQVIARIKDDALSRDMVDMPTLDLLIPSDWTFTGSMEFNKVEGCFIDLYAAAWAATSPDGTIAFSGAPNTIGRDGFGFLERGDS
jgi:hypothetical protein